MKSIKEIIHNDWLSRRYGSNMPYALRLLVKPIFFRETAATYKELLKNEANSQQTNR